MLVLSRHRDESIMIGDDIVITIVDIRGDKVRLGIDAPSDIPVHRQEVYDAIQRENRKALSDGTRQEILRLLEGQQRTVGEIVGNFNLSQPTISRHLSVLKEADLVLDATHHGSRHRVWNARRIGHDFHATLTGVFIEPLPHVAGTRIDDMVGAGSKGSLASHPHAVHADDRRCPRGDEAAQRELPDDSETQYGRRPAQRYSRADRRTHSISSNAGPRRLIRTESIR